MTRLLPFSVVVLVAVACQRSPAVEAVEPRPATPPQAANAAPPTTSIGSALSLTRNSDGTVRLKGSDRWGKQIDVTYENVDWLKKAVPVVSRGLLPEQVAQLDKDIAAL